MYEGGKGGGLGSAMGGSSAILLPNTGGNTILTVVAITGIVVGSAIVLTTLVRMVVKRAYAKA